MTTDPAQIAAKALPCDDYCLEMAETGQHLGTCAAFHRPAVVAAFDPAIRKLVEERDALLEFVRKNTGWNGNGPSSTDHYYCEFCGAYDLDDTKIPHRPNCERMLLLAKFQKAGTR